MWGKTNLYAYEIYKLSSRSSQNIDFYSQSKNKECFVVFLKNICTYILLTIRCGCRYVICVFIHAHIFGAQSGIDPTNWVFGPFLGCAWKTSGVNRWLRLHICETRTEVSWKWYFCLFTERIRLLGMRISYRLRNWLFRFD